jgi:hypothetical protein
MPLQAYLEEVVIGRREQAIREAGGVALAAALRARWGLSRVAGVGWVVVRHEGPVMEFLLPDGSRRARDNSKRFRNETQIDGPQRVYSPAEVTKMVTASLRYLSLIRIDNNDWKYR